METLVAPDPARLQVIEHQIDEQGYATVPFDLGHSACHELFASFENFIELTEQPGGQRFIDAVSFDINDRGDGRYYYAHRIPGAVNPREPERPPGLDHKQEIHFGSRTINNAFEALGAYMPSEMSTFLANCQEFYWASVRASRIGAAALGLEEVLFGSDPYDWCHHLRLLRYLQGGLAGLAEPHFDRSIATLAFYENLAGLRGVVGQNGYLWPLDADDITALHNGLTPIDHQEGEAKYFLGAGYNHLSESNHFPPRMILGHDAENLFEDLIRLAGVFFLDPHNNYPGYSIPQGYETGFDGIKKHYLGEDN